MRRLRAATGESGNPESFRLCIRTGREREWAWRPTYEPAPEGVASPVSGFPRYPGALLRRDAAAGSALSMIEVAVHADLVKLVDHWVRHATEKLQASEVELRSERLAETRELLATAIGDLDHAMGLIWEFEQRERSAARNGNDGAKPDHGVERRGAEAVEGGCGQAGFGSGVPGDGDDGAEGVV